MYRTSQLLSRKLTARQTASLEVAVPETSQVSNTDAISPSTQGPITRLPVEILSRIFCETTLAPTPSSSSSENYITLPTMPLPEIPTLGAGIGATLGKVSKQGRAVAIITPLLWSSFSFTLFAPEQSTELLEWYLTQSLKCPLTVQIRTRRPVEGSPTGERAHSDRLRRLRLSPFALGWEIPSIHGMRGRLSSLEILQVDIVWDGMGDTFQIAPRLKSVALTCTPGPWAFALPRRNISSLRIQSLDATVAAAYQQVTHLDCARFGSRSRLELPNVHSWRVDVGSETWFMGSETWRKTVYGAKMPGLETLHIVQSTRDVSSELDPSPFISKSRRVR
jgi:hypothetical protein